MITRSTLKQNWCPQGSVLLDECDKEAATCPASSTGRAVGLRRRPRDALVSAVRPA